MKLTRFAGSILFANLLILSSAPDFSCNQYIQSYIYIQFKIKTMYTCVTLTPLLITPPTEPEGKFSSGPRLRAVNKAVSFSLQFL